MHQTSEELQAEINTWATDIFQKMPVLHLKLQTMANEANSTTTYLLQEALKFLYLIGTYQQKLSPSLLVDLTWHEFILCTRLYHDFCLEKFSRFIHHTPGGEETENHKRFLKTIQLYILTFGKPPHTIWGDLANQEWEESQCGSCNAN